MILYILINPFAVRTDKGDVFKKKKYLHEHTIDVRALLSCAFCDDPYVNASDIAGEKIQVRLTSNAIITSRLMVFKSNIECNSDSNNDFPKTVSNDIIIVKDATEVPIVRSGLL